MAGTVCLFAGWGFSLVGVDKLHQALHASVKPVPITGAQLRSYKPGSNVHITLTQFVPYMEGILVFSASDSHSQSFLVPVLPADAPKDDPRHIVAAVYLPKVSDEAALRRKLTEPRWTGILNRRGELVKEMIQLNPGINTEQCWVMWEGSQPEKLAGALPFVMVCPCLFILGMVLAAVTALRPLTSPSAVSPSPLILNTFAFSALGDGLRWLQRHGFSLGRLAVLSALGGLAAVGTGSFLLYRDWDRVVSMTGGMMLAVTLGLIGLGLLANAILFASWSWSTEMPAPAPVLSRLTQVEERPSDRRQKGSAAMCVGLFLLVAAGAAFYRGDTSLRPLVLAAIGCPALVGGAVWYGILQRKGREEKAQFWNESGV